MKRWTIACVLLLFAGAAAQPQTAQIQAEIDKVLHQTRVYQDIEILRRIVQRRVAAFAASCSKCHSDPFAEPSGWRPNSSASVLSEGIMRSGGAADPNEVWAQFMDVADSGKRPARVINIDSYVVDGHYVKGQGVVLQAQLPTSLLSFSRQPETKVVKKPQPAPSEWDQIRRQLWGEKVETPATPREDPHATNIQEVLLQVLAENGKNFQSLGANEQLTLNVTFRDVQAGGGAGQATAGNVADPNRKLLEEWITARGYAAPQAGGGAPTAPGGEDKGDGANISFKDYELLADFHLKQGRYQEAVKTLQKALEVNKDASRTGRLYRKLASAYLLQDAGQANPQVLEKAAEFLKRAQEVTKAAAAPVQRLALPTRLVIAASRPALQQASPGNLDEFRRQISATWLRFEHPVLEHKGEAGAPEKTSGK